MMPVYKKKIPAIAGAVFIILLLTGMVWAVRQQGLSLPAADGVVMIEMEQFNEGSSLGPVVLNDKKRIGAVLSALSSAGKTLKMSVNDIPVSENVLMVRIHLKGERRTVCLYSEDGGYYAEEPYVGIYRSSREASVALYKINNADTGALPAGIIKQ